MSRILKALNQLDQANRGRAPQTQSVLNPNQEQGRDPSTHISGRTVIWIRSRWIWIVAAVSLLVGIDIVFFQLQLPFSTTGGKPASGQPVTTPEGEYGLSAHQGVGPPHAFSARPSNQGLQQADVPPAKPRSSAGTISSSSSETAVPQAVDLPPSPKADYLYDGRIKIQAIVWAPSRQDRMVVVNNHVAVEGDVVNGFSIVEIHRDGVLVKADGKLWTALLGR